MKSVNVKQEDAVSWQGSAPCVCVLGCRGGSSVNPWEEAINDRGHNAPLCIPPHIHASWTLLGAVTLIYVSTHTRTHAVLHGGQLIPHTAVSLSLSLSLALLKPCLSLC